MAKIMSGPNLENTMTTIVMKYKAVEGSFRGQIK